MSYRWYTKARRFPKMLGRMPDGTRIWGGPYTFTQLGAGAATAVVLKSTTWLWAQGGLLVNLFTALMFIGAAVYFAGYLPPGMRNPITLAPGFARTFGRGWRLHGEPIATVKPQQVSGVSFVLEESQPLPAVLPEPEPEVAYTPAQVIPTPVSASANAAPAPLSSVQRLLLEGTLR